VFLRLDVYVADPSVSHAYLVARSSHVSFPQMLDLSTSTAQIITTNHLSDVRCMLVDLVYKRLWVFTSGVTATSSSPHPTGPSSLGPSAAYTQRIKLCLSSHSRAYPRRPHRTYSSLRTNRELTVYRRLRDGLRSTDLHEHRPICWFGSCIGRSVSSRLRTEAALDSGRPITEVCLCPLFCF
jgi:hypothetical protein